LPPEFFPKMAKSRGGVAKAALGTSAGKKRLAFLFEPAISTGHSGLKWNCGYD
jgi:hypothetical protein